MLNELKGGTAAREEHPRPGHEVSADLDKGILAVLAESGPLGARDLRDRLHIRKQRLLQTIKRLMATGEIEARPGRGPARDGKVRGLVAFAVADRGQEPGSCSTRGDSSVHSQDPRRR
jgi:predicted ArsR family transcriptional regulator